MNKFDLVKKFSAYIIIAFSISCSPYKKVVLTASEQLTNRWKGKTEQAVFIAYGSYKSKSEISGGYIIRYDYSYVIPPQISKNRDFQVHASSQTNPMTPNPATIAHQSPDDSVIRRMDFVFDKSKIVQSVEAMGYPDSVYLIKRK